MDGLIRIILNDIIKDASKGSIPIYTYGKKSEYNLLKVGFSSKIGNQEYISSLNNMLLNVESYEAFIEVLKEYANLILEREHQWNNIGLNEYQNLKKHQFASEQLYCYLHDNIVFLLLNATKEDFLEPVSLVNRYIDFLMPDTLEELKDGLSFYSSTLDCDVDIKLEEQPYGQETPNAIVCRLTGEKIKVTEKENSLENGKQTGYLPFIRAGVANENGKKVMYLYALQNIHGPFNYRKLYQLNKDVSQELQSISPNFVLAMSILVALMKRYQIEELRMPHDLSLKMQIKYQGAIPDEVAMKYSPSKRAALGIRTESQVRQIEKNMNQRFLQNAFRIAFHGSNIQIDETEEHLLKVNIDFQNNHFGNPIMEELYESIPTLQVEKKKSY